MKGLAEQKNRRATDACETDSLRQTQSERALQSPFVGRVAEMPTRVAENASDTTVATVFLARFSA